MGARKQRDDLEGRLAAALERVSELERELDLRLYRDPVTGLSTLRSFGDRLDAEVERARRHGRPLSVALLDLDGFRTLNGHYGRETGDRVLGTVGRVLSECTRVNDLVCRASADEFLVAFPETDGPEALQCLERVLVELERSTVDRASCPSASIGVAIYERPQTAEQLIRRAGKAMDRARVDGGGRALVLDEAQGSFEVAAANAAQRDAIAGLAVALLERDRYTGEHSESVVEMAMGVARSMALDEQEVERIGAAALLHDIGKVAIPDEILHKPAPLDPDETLLMREHPVIGERILRAIPGLGGVARIVRHEHESWDGSGYPDGLKGDRIPIGSRIILACDAYHAMASDRPYRKAISHGEAISELASAAGTQFDPAVTQVLIGHLYGRRQGTPSAGEGSSSTEGSGNGSSDGAATRPRALAGG